VPESNGVIIGVNSTAERLDNATDGLDAASTYEPSSFWRSLDLNGEIKCGEYKCLFPQRDSGEGKRIAYLIGKNDRGYQFGLETEVAWKLAEYLERVYHVEHLFLEPPGRVSVLPEALEVFENQTSKKRPMYAAGQFATVQKVLLASEPFVQVMAREWTKFKWLYRKQVVNNTAFANAIRKNVEPVIDMIEAVPILAIDFQMIVDVEGNIYQFDLDRAFLGSVYKQEGFPTKFAKAYHFTTVLLRRMRKWAHSHKGNEEDPRVIRDAETVAAEYLARNRSLSCDAVTTVEKMAGRIGKGGNVTTAAKLMQVHLVQKVLFEGPERRKDGLWNCSV